MSDLNQVKVPENSLQQQNRITTLHCLESKLSLKSYVIVYMYMNVQVGKDQEKAQSEKKPLQKPTCRWEKTKLTIRHLYHENISLAE